MEAEGVASVRVDGLIVVVARGAVGEVHDGRERCGIHLRIPRGRLNLRALDTARRIDDVIDRDAADGLFGLQSNRIRGLRGAELLRAPGAPLVPFASLAFAFASAEGFLACLSGFSLSCFSCFSAFISFSTSGTLMLSSMTMRSGAAASGSGAATCASASALSSDGCSSSVTLS